MSRPRFETGTSKALPLEPSCSMFSVTCEICMNAYCFTVPTKAKNKEGSRKANCRVVPVERLGAAVHVLKMKWL
jgi:hypothetical protein